MCEKEPCELKITEALLFSIILFPTTYIDFLVKPASVTAVLNSTAVFYCNASGQMSGWKINDYNEDHALNHKSGITNVERNHEGSCVIESTLTIPVTRELNNSMIKCMVFGGTSGYIESDSHLTVQGKNLYAWSSCEEKS